MSILGRGGTSLIVKVMVVDTKLQTPVLLLDHDHHGGPRTLGWSDESLPEHLLHLLVLLILDVRILAAVGNPHWAPFHMDLMLSHLGAA